MTSKDAPKTPKKTSELDESEDAMRRFEHAVDIALHTPPMHREPKKKSKRVTKGKEGAKKAG